MKKLKIKLIVKLVRLISWCKTLRSSKKKTYESEVSEPVTYNLTSIWPNEKSKKEALQHIR